MANNTINKSALQDTWTMFRREHECSVDRMVCDPVLRSEFLESVRGICGTDDEFTILWTAMNLRKAKSLGAVEGPDTQHDEDGPTTTMGDAHASLDCFQPNISGDESR